LNCTSKPLGETAGKVPKDRYEAHDVARLVGVPAAIVRQWVRKGLIVKVWRS
jgi:hypothetical protein